MQHIHWHQSDIRQLRVWQRWNVPHIPSALDIQDTWERLTESLPHLFHPAAVRYEYRYPFLDRDLVDFLMRLPPRQLRRPGRRRYMMRNALRDIVPAEILERRRKAYVSRGPLLAIQSSTMTIASLVSSGALVKRGIVDRDSFLHMLAAIEGGSSLEWLPAMRRAIELEIWMSQAANQETETPFLFEKQNLHENSSSSLCGNSQRGAV